MNDAIPEAEMTAAYQWALEHADIKARNRGGEVAEIARDAATDGLMWARDNYLPARGAFGPFCAAAVRRVVGRAILAHVQRERPAVFSLDAADDDGGDGRPGKEASPMLIGDLPEDLAFAVRLYMVDGFGLRDCGALLGVGPNVVQRMLRKAAALLAPGRTAPIRRAGERRLGRTKYEAD